MGNQNSAVRLTAPIRWVCPSSALELRDACADGHKDTNLAVPAPTWMPILTFYNLFIYLIILKCVYILSSNPPVVFNGIRGWTDLFFQALGVCYTDPADQVFHQPLQFHE